MNPTDQPENPWKKRRKPGLYFFPPSRALLAQKNGSKASATWCLIGDLWVCKGGSGILKWMRGCKVSNTQQADSIRAALQSFQWQWIVPLYSKGLMPPF